MLYAIPISGLRTLLTIVFGETACNSVGGFSLNSSSSTKSSKNSLSKSYWLNLLVVFCCAPRPFWKSLEFFEFKVSILSFCLMSQVQSRLFSATARFLASGKYAHCYSAIERSGHSLETNVICNRAVSKLQLRNLDIPRRSAPIPIFSNSFIFKFSN